MKGLLVKLRYQKRHTSAVTKLLSLMCLFLFMYPAAYQIMLHFYSVFFSIKALSGANYNSYDPRKSFNVYCDPLQISMTLYFKLRRQIQDRYSRKNADIRRRGDGSNVFYQYVFTHQQYYMLFRCCYN